MKKADIKMILITVATAALVYYLLVCLGVVKGFTFTSGYKKSGKKEMYKKKLLEHYKKKNEMYKKKKMDLMPKEGYKKKEMYGPKKKEGYCSSCK